MEQQTVRVTDTFNIEQFYFRIFICLEILVHILQHIFHTYLLGIPHRPDRIELQSFCHRTLQNKDCRCTGTGNQIYSLQAQLRNRLTEYAVMPRVHQPDAVRPDQRSTVCIHRCQNPFFEQCTFVRLFAKTGRENDKCLRLLSARQRFYHIRTQRRRNGKNRQIGIGYVFGIGKRRNPLHFRLLRVDGTKFTTITTIDKIL